MVGFIGGTDKKKPPSRQCLSKLLEEVTPVIHTPVLGLHFCALTDGKERMPVQRLDEFFSHSAFGFLKMEIPNRAIL